MHSLCPSHMHRLPDPQAFPPDASHMPGSSLPHVMGTRQQTLLWQISPPKSGLPSVHIICSQSLLLVHLTPTGPVPNSPIPDSVAVEVKVKPDLTLLYVTFISAL